MIIKIPNLQALQDMNERILILGGGLPVVLGNEVMGGIGVGGAPGTQLDEACALAGLTSIGARPEVVPRIRTGCYATICDQRRVMDYESNP